MWASNLGRSQSRPNKASLKCPSVRPSVRRGPCVNRKFLRFQWNLACTYTSSQLVTRHLFESFTIRGCFSKKMQKLLKRFPGLATSGRHNSATITNAENSRHNGPPTRCLVSIFKVTINSVSLPGAVRCTLEAHSPNVFAILITYLWYL